MSCSTSKDEKCVIGANLWPHLKIFTSAERWIPAKCLVVLRNYSQGRRLLCRLDDEELMLLKNRGNIIDECVSVWWWPVSPSPVRVQERDCRSSPTSSARSKLPPKWWMLTAAPLLSFSPASLFPLQWEDSEPLGWGENKFVALWKPTSWPMTGRREELRESEEGIEKREGGILCNGVENTKERQTHAFVIFVFLHPLFPTHLLLRCLLFPVSLFFWLQIHSSVSPSGSNDVKTVSFADTEYPFHCCIVIIMPVL